MNLNSSGDFKILLLILLFSCPVFPQFHDSSDIFKSIILEINLSRNINNELIHNFWDIKTGIGSAVSSEFYMGEIGFEFDYLSFKKKSSGLPDFKSLFLSLLWKNTIYLFPP